MIPRFARLLPLFLWPLASVLAQPASERAASHPDIAAVRAADDERLAATLARDRARLDAILSDDLHYGHSSGKVDTKASQVEGIVSGRYSYVGFEHRERNFTPAAPGVVLMTGRALVHIMPPGATRRNTLDLTYLAVWREEQGRWRFLAWQSCRNPPPAESKK